MPQNNNRVRLACLAMRSRFELVLESENTNKRISNSISEASLRAAGEESLLVIPETENLLSAYLPSSELYRLNQTAGTRSVPVSAPMMQFLLEARRLSEETKGAFDITVGPLLDLWGISQNGGDPPTDSQINEALARVGYAKVLLDTATQSVSFAHPKMRLDPGAIGKGWAIDRAIEILREMGITRALLHGGTSTVATIGTWEIALEDGTPISLCDQALSVSAWDGKSFARPDGTVLGHVIDPRTGYPINARPQAHYIHTSATVTDAMSTALLIASDVLK
jgi:FAD:protein FMN transferase